MLGAFIKLPWYFFPQSSSISRLDMLLLGMGKLSLWLVKPKQRIEDCKPGSIPNVEHEHSPSRCFFWRPGPTACSGGHSY